MDDILASIDGATELAVMKDGDPPVSLSDVGIQTAELNVAPTSKVGLHQKGPSI